MEKQRIIQEFVPGKQISLAHLIANPDSDVRQKLGLGADDRDTGNAIGILTITPSEAAIIAADVATKSGDIKLGFIDRFSGSLLISGDVCAVESAIMAIQDMLCNKMEFSPVELTRS